VWCVHGVSGGAGVCVAVVGVRGGREGLAHSRAVQRSLPTCPLPPLRIHQPFPPPPPPFQRLVLGLCEVESVACGGMHTLALGVDGVVYGWCVLVPHVFSLSCTLGESFDQACLSSILPPLLLWMPGEATCLVRLARDPWRVPACLPRYPLLFLPTYKRRAATWTQTCGRWPLMCTRGMVTGVYMQGTATAMGRARYASQSLLVTYDHHVSAMTEFTFPLVAHPDIRHPSSQPPHSLPCSLSSAMVTADGKVWLWGLIGEESKLAPVPVTSLSHLTVIEAALGRHSMFIARPDAAEGLGVLPPALPFQAESSSPQPANASPAQLPLDAGMPPGDGPRRARFGGGDVGAVEGGAGLARQEATPVKPALSLSPHPHHHAHHAHFEDPVPGGKEEEEEAQQDRPRRRLHSPPPRAGQGGSRDPEGAVPHNLTPAPDHVVLSLLGGPPAPPDRPVTASTPAPSSLPPSAAPSPPPGAPLGSSSGGGNGDGSAVGSCVGSPCPTRGLPSPRSMQGSPLPGQVGPGGGGRASPLVSVQPPALPSPALQPSSTSGCSGGQSFVVVSPRASSGHRAGRLVAPGTPPLMAVEGLVVPEGFAAALGGHGAPTGLVDDAALMGFCSMRQGQRLSSAGPGTGAEDPMWGVLQTASDAITHGAPSGAPAALRLDGAAEAPVLSTPSPRASQVEPIREPACAAAAVAPPSRPTASEATGGGSGPAATVGDAAPSADPMPTATAIAGGAPTMSTAAASSSAGSVGTGSPLNGRPPRREGSGGARAGGARGGRRSGTSAAVPEAHHGSRHRESIRDTSSDGPAPAARARREGSAHAEGRQRVEHHGGHRGHGHGHGHGAGGGRGGASNSSCSVLAPGGDGVGNAPEAAGRRLRMQRSASAGSTAGGSGSGSGSGSADPVPREGGDRLPALVSPPGARRVTSGDTVLQKVASSGLLRKG
jgi:hypothetical protein